MGSYEIRYIRDREKREVDFTLVKDNEPVALFEAKESETGIDKSGMFYSKKMGIPSRAPIKILQYAARCRSCVCDGPH